MDIKKKVSKGISWSAAEKAGNQIITFLVTVVLIRLLSPETFGLIAAATAAIAFFSLFTNYGFTSAIVQRDELEPEHLNCAFWISLFAHSAMLIVVFMGAPYIAMLFKMPELQDVIRCLSAMFLLTALSQVQMGLLRRELAFRELAIRQLIASACGGAVGIAMAVMGVGIWSLVVRQLLTTFMATILLWWLVSWRPRMGFSFKHSKDLLSFGLNMTGTNIVGFLSKRSDELLIGYFLGPAALGYYHVGYRLVRVMIEFLGQTVNNVAWPAFARMQSTPKRLREVFYRATAGVSFLAFPATLGVCAVAPEFVRVVFGEQWIPSIPVMQILSFLGLIQVLMLIQESVLVGMGKPQWRFGLKTALGIGSLAAFFVAVHWGIVAIAFAYLFIHLMFVPVSLHLVGRIISTNYRTYIFHCLGPAVASIIMIGVIQITKIWTQEFSSGVELGSLIVVGVFVYSIIIILFSPKLLQEVRSILGTMLRPSTSN